jgi:3-dehydroquinate synthase
MSSDREATIGVRAGGGRADYDVVVRRRLLGDVAAWIGERAPAHRYAVISDHCVASLYGGKVCAALDAEGSADLYTFPAGEEHKTRATWGRLTDRLLDEGHGRDSVVVAVGGGVTGDLAGFVASTFMRGVPCVQVPTSMVAMIDAAVGGKTGVDSPAGKNLVGAFHPPRVVLVDPETIETLPRTERAQGLAEAVKHGAILDAGYLESLGQNAPQLLDGVVDVVEGAVRRSIEIKADVVGRDEKEGDLRQILNFGHTLGHALESASGYALPHGSAVSLGMVLEARLGERIGVTREGTAGELAATLAGLGLPTEIAHALDRGEESRGILDPARIVDFVGRDKKGRAGRPRFVLLEEPGVVGRGVEGWSRTVEAGEVQRVLAEAVGGP